MQFLIMVAISIAISLVAYLLTPKPKQPKPPGARDLEGPTAEAGRPVPVVFGTMTIKGVNIIWFGDKKVKEFEVKS